MTGGGREKTEPQRPEPVRQGHCKGQTGCSRTTGAVSGEQRPPRKSKCGAASVEATGRGRWVTVG